MAKEKRFEKIYTQGAGAIEIWVVRKQALIIYTTQAVMQAV